MTHPAITGWRWHRFQRSGQQKDIAAAWDLYYAVYRTIRKQLPALTTLSLKNVSPRLAGWYFFFV